jgi:predicted Zn finger-like uncharacterized protein
MVRGFPYRDVATALVDVEPVVEPVVQRDATCPLCHTTASLSNDALAAGEGWRCARCGQQWDARRLATAAAYAAWAVTSDVGAGC